MKNKTLAIIVIFLFSVIAGRAQIATGGTYTISQSVIASGGGTSADANGTAYTLVGVIGEPVAGTTSDSTPYTIRGGFFNSASFVPTAAAATVGGRVLTRDGAGIRNVIITMTAFNGTVRTALSSAFGYFRFQEVPSGETYVFSATGKRFAFDQSTQVVSVTQDSDEIIFVGSLIDENSPTRQRAND